LRDPKNQPVGCQWLRHSLHHTPPQFKVKKYPNVVVYVYLVAGTLGDATNSISFSLEISKMLTDIQSQINQTEVNPAGITLIMTYSIKAQCNQINSVFAHQLSEHNNIHVIQCCCHQTSALWCCKEQAHQIAFIQAKQALKQANLLFFVSDSYAYFSQDKIDILNSKFISRNCRSYDIRQYGVNPARYDSSVSQ